jgi:hypothetical protein
MRVAIEGEVSPQLLKCMSRWRRIQIKTTYEINMLSKYYIYNK